MIRKALLIAASVASFSIRSQAAISFNIQADLLQNAAGNPMSSNGLVLFIVSTLDSNFDRILEGADRSAVGSPLRPNSDDYVVFRSTNLGSGIDGVFDKATGNLNLATIPGWNTGDPLAIVWFPTVISASNSLLSANTQYGIYFNLSAIGIDGSRPWLTPTDPSSAVGLAFFTSNASGNIGDPGSNPAAAGRPSQTVEAVPEPISVGLLALGLAGLATRRRRV